VHCPFLNKETYSGCLFGNFGIQFIIFSIYWSIIWTMKYKKVEKNDLVMSSNCLFCLKIKQKVNVIKWSVNMSVFLFCKVSNISEGWWSLFTSMHLWNSYMKHNFYRVFRVLQITACRIREIVWKHLLPPYGYREALQF